MQDDSGTNPDHSAPFDRGGGTAVFSFAVTHIRAGVTLVVAVEHRDAEGAWSDAGAVSTSSVGVSALRVSGLKKELRLKLTSSLGAVGDSARLLIAPPRWFPS